VKAFSNTKIALITGSNKGIGFEIARKIGSDEENEFVCLLGCRDESLGQAAVSSLKEEGVDAKFVKVDLEDLDSIKEAVLFIREKYGRCDVLVNNAAVCFNDPTLYGKVQHTPFETQAEISVRTNFFGTLAVTQQLIPLLSQSESPRIINIASSAGRLSILPSKQRQQEFTSPSLELDNLKRYMNDFVEAAEVGNHQENGWPNTGYGMSKLGIIALTKILARDYPKFMIHSVDPGFCATDQNNNQGYLPAERGSITPHLLAILKEPHMTGIHWFQEQEIEW
jgi:carbonyl reductase 1